MSKFGHSQSKETIVLAKESKLASHNEQNKNKKAKNA
jgi:hypothetical protein